MSQRAEEMLHPVLPFAPAAGGREEAISLLAGLGAAALWTAVPPLRALGMIGALPVCAAVAAARLALRPAAVGPEASRKYPRSDSKNRSAPASPADPPSRAARTAASCTPPSPPSTPPRSLHRGNSASREPKSRVAGTALRVFAAISPTPSGRSPLKTKAPASRALWAAAESRTRGERGAVRGRKRNPRGTRRDCI